MGRAIKSWQKMPEAPSTYEVAPHRYLFDMDSSYRDEKDYRAFLAGVPYKVGEVIYVECEGTARKAYVLEVFYEHDRYGDRREKYRILTANKKGDQFSRNWEWTHPGFVQRGYKAAGLAPDVLDD